MKKIAFLTSEEDPSLIKDDQLVIPVLAKMGYAVLPLVWDRNEDLSKITSSQLVIKPAIPMSGHDTHLVSANDIEKVKILVHEIVGSRDVLIQEFVPEIKTNGEVSLLFFDGKFSHAVQKKPRQNEFRIHVEYGGSREGYEASAALIQQAQKIVEMVDSKLLFARVDFVERQGKPAALIELEIIDPMLYLGYSNGAPERFAQAVAEYLSDYE